MNKQFQHLTEDQRNNIIGLLQKLEYILMEL